MSKLQLTTRSSNAHIKDDVRLKLSEVNLALMIWSDLPAPTKRSWQSVFEPISTMYKNNVSRKTPRDLLAEDSREFEASFSSEIFEKFYDDISSNNTSFDEYAVRADDDEEVFLLVSPR